MTSRKLVQASPEGSSNSTGALWADKFRWIGESCHSEYVVSSGAETIGKIVRAGSFTAPEHAHPEAQFSLFRKGASAVLATHNAIGRSNQTSVAPGSVAFIPHHQPHRTHWQGEGELLNIYFSPEFMERMSDNGRYMLALQPFSYRQEATVAAIGRCLLDEFDRSGSITCELLDHAKFLIATRLLHLMDANQARKSSGTLNATRLKPALELIHARSEDHITLAELAELCGVSIFHFARSFKARFGSAPLVYQRTLRLQRACNLLRESRLPVEAIAVSVGFESASNFSRLFHREAGLCPSAYRQVHQNARPKIARKEC